MQAVRRLALLLWLSVLAVACSDSTDSAASIEAPDPRLEIAAVSDVPEGSGLYAIGDRVYLVDSPTDGLIALFEKDPHLGCRILSVLDEDDRAAEAIVTFDETRFFDPCHGSQYDISGLWLDGPSPRSMDRIPITVVDDTIYFDGGAPIERVPRP